MADYSSLKIPQFQKPYKPLYDAMIDQLEADRNDVLTNYATQVWVQSQIATGGIDWSVFGDPNDILKLNSAGDTPEGVTYEELAVLLDPYITGGGGTLNETANKLFLGNATTSKTTVYTATEKTVLSGIRLNNTIGDATTNMYIGITPSGSSEFGILDIDFTDGIVYNEKPVIVLQTGDSIQVQAASNNIFTVSLSESIINKSDYTRMFILNPTTVKATVYTATEKTELKSLRLNNSVGDATTNMYIGITPNGGSEIAILDNDYAGGIIINEEINIVLETGDSIQVQAGANNIFTATITGKTF